MNEMVGTLLSTVVIFAILLVGAFVLALILEGFK